MEATISCAFPADTEETARPQPSPSQPELTESEHKDLKATGDEYQKKMHHFRPAPTNDTRKHEGGKEGNDALSARERQAEERLRTN